MFDFDDIEETDPGPPPTQGGYAKPAQEVASTGSGGFQPIAQDTTRRILDEIGPRTYNSTNWPHTDLKFEIEGSVATLTLWRLQQFNQLGNDLMEAFIDALVELHNRVGRIRVVVVRGGGAKFCMGLELGNMSSLIGSTSNTDEIPPAFEAQMTRDAYVFYLLSALPQFVIGVVRGPAAGGGCGILTMFDYVMALDTPKVFFQWRECSTGTVCISWPYVVAKLGAAKAKIAIMQAWQMTATEAKEIGLVNYVTSDKDEFQKKLEEMVSRMSQSAPETVATAKRYLADLSGNAPTVEKIKWTVAETWRTISAPDMAEGVSAYTQGRAPSWSSETLKAPEPLKGQP